MVFGFASIDVVQKKHVFVHYFAVSAKTKAGRDTLIRMKLSYQCFKYCQSINIPPYTFDSIDNVPKRARVEKPSAAAIRTVVYIACNY